MKPTWLALSIESDREVCTACTSDCSPSRSHPASVNDATATISGDSVVFTNPVHDYSQYLIGLHFQRQTITAWQNPRIQSADCRGPNFCPRTFSMARLNAGHSSLVPLMQPLAAASICIQSLSVKSKSDFATLPLLCSLAVSLRRPKCY